MGQNAGTMKGREPSFIAGRGRKDTNKHLYIPPPTAQEPPPRSAPKNGDSKKVVGLAAALEEYHEFKSNGQLAQWRDRWKAVLEP